jgi:LysR family nitrogen assimilation transcriptional regulator
MASVSQGVAGQVSVGLAPGTAATTLALPLLRQVRAVHPGIVLYLNENYGTTLSELIMNGRMDLAVLYGNRPIHGLTFLPLMDEELYFVGPAVTADPVRLSELRDVELVLPRPYNIVRKLIDENFARIGMAPRVVAEIESAVTLQAVIADGLGATILPASMAREMAASRKIWCRRIVDPVIAAPLTLCESDHLPLSEPARVVKDILLGLAQGLLTEASFEKEADLAPS